MSLDIENPDGAGGLSCWAAEGNSCSVGRPGRIKFFPGVFGYHFARRSPSDETRYNFAFWRFSIA